MIKQGDKFTFIDLQRSIRELCDLNIRLYVNGIESRKTGILFGDCAISPVECSPDEYAEMCNQIYDNTHSSAIQLDTQLQNKGIKTTYKFSYPYKIVGLTSPQIVHDAYCLDWFQQIYKTAVPYKESEDKYFDILNNAFRLSYYYAQYLWAYNKRVTGNIAKALHNPNETQWSQIISAILGIGFQFNPVDVYEYAIKHTSNTLTPQQFEERYKEQFAFKTEMKNNYNINTGCLVLSPQSRNRLRKIVTGTEVPYCFQVIKNLIMGRNR